MKTWTLVVSLLAVATACLGQTASQSQTGSQPQSSHEAPVYTHEKDGATIGTCSNKQGVTWTKDAKKAHATGVVLLSGIIELDGTISNLRVLQSPGYGMDEAALKAVQKWKCKPGTLNGKSVRVKVPFQITP